MGSSWHVMKSILIITNKLVKYKDFSVMIKTRYLQLHFVDTLSYLPGILLYVYTLLSWF